MMVLGRSLCAVGDDNKVFLYGIDENIPLSEGNLTFNNCLIIIII
jgi:hypothetical protein